MSLENATQYTEDSLFSGDLICRQHKDGYRFSIDAVLLAHFITPKPSDRVLDLCAGCGVVSLILAFRWPQLRLGAIELQPALAELCRGNVALNNFSGRIEVIEGDARQMNTLVESGSFDWVVCNPPYRKVLSGRQNPEDEQAIARHEINLTLAEMVQAAAYAVRTKGRVAIVYPAARLASLLAALKDRGLEPKRLQLVHSYPGDVGRLALVEAVMAGGEELQVLPPFYIYQEKDGAYTDEMAKLYRL